MLGLLVSLLSSTIAPDPVAADRAIAVKVDQVYTGEGEVLRGGYLIIRDGILVDVAAASVPEGAWVLEYPGASACPGFIDPVTGLGAGRNLQEPARAVLPQAHAKHSLAPFHRDFRQAARQGLITVGLSPTSDNLIGGHLAVVRTSGPEEAAAFVQDGPMRMALVDDAFEWNRAPTSRMGAMHLLRQEIGEDFADSVVIDARSADQIRLSLELLGGSGQSVTVLHATEADEVRDSLAAAGASVILGPYTLSSSRHDLKLAAELADSGVPVAFTGNGHAAHLRTTAALAMKEGLPAKEALRALTSVPAKILGVEKESGTLAKGKRADLLIFSGHPLDLASRLEAVMIAGLPIELGSTESPKKGQGQ